MGNFPNMDDAFEEWSNATTFKVVTKTNVNGYITESTSSSTLQGVLVPMQFQRIYLKPEGQRTWKWETLITKTKLNLDDVIVDNNNIQYRVFGIQDYSKAGFYEYELVQGFV